MDIFDWKDGEVLTSQVELTEIDKHISNAFDYDFDGKSEFNVPFLDHDRLPDDFGILLIVGKSGGGKSTLMKQFGEEEAIEWDNTKSVASNFESFEDADSRLNGAGFNSIHDWVKPFSNLSTGQKYRATLARSFKDGAVVDEFTSVVDRHTALSLSNSVRRYVDNQGIKRLVLCSCHRDIIEFLQPDWIFDVDTGILASKESLRRRRPINLSIRPCKISAWEKFSGYHYLTSDINKSSKCWLMEWDGILVGFYSVLPQPSGTMKHAWRGHRCVILPEFQGLGFGKHLSNTIAQLHINEGKRFFAKTSGILGKGREQSDLWKPTSKNKMCRLDYAESKTTINQKHINEKFSQEYKNKHMNRICYSHEYIGNLGNP